MNRRLNLAAILFSLIAIATSAATIAATPSRVILVDGKGATQEYQLVPVPPTSPASPPLSIEPEGPAKTPPPAPTPANTRIADAKPSERRGDGFTIKQPGRYANILARGFEQNITIAPNVAGVFELENVRTIDAWRGLKAHENVGQGIYGGEGPSQIVIRNWYAGRNGWQSDKDPGEKNDRRHGGYFNTGGSLTVEWFILDENCAQGLKTMRPSTLRNGFIHRNALAVSGIYGTTKLENVVIYDGAFYVDKSGNTTGNTALAFYDLAQLVDVDIVGSPTPFNPAPAAKGPYSMGAIQLSNYHPQYKNLAGGRIEAKNVRIVGWQGETFTGEMFAKQKKALPKGATLAVPGITVTNRPVDARAVIEPIMRAVEAGRLSVEDGVKEAQAAVRSRIGAP